MNDSPLNFVSLFAGIGGIDLGLERAGMRCVGQVEIDPFCRKVLAKHWPDVPRYEDVRTITAETFRGVRVDCLVGGFPCTDISSAGKKIGIGGEKSGLWSEFARLVRSIRPRFVIVENVAALLNRDLARVLQDLAESGLDAEWESLPCGLFGAPHIRARTFVVGYADGDGEPVGSVNAKARGMSGLVANAEHAFLSCRGEMGRAWGKRESVPWDAAGECTDSSLAVRMDDGISNRMDRLSALGNAVVPAVAEFIGRRIIEGRPQWQP